VFRQVAAAGCAVTAALSACALGPARAPDGALPAEAVVLELEAASWAAWQAHDAPFFEQFLADDRLDVHASGIADKAAVVAAVRSAACSVRSRSLGPMKATRWVNVLFQQTPIR